MPKFCAELQELCLQDRQLLVSVEECRARLCLVAAAHVTARTQELSWQHCRLISVLLILVNEIILIEGTGVLRKQTFWLAYTGIWPGQRSFSCVLASSIIRTLTRLPWTVYLSEKWHLLKPNTSQAWYTGEPTAILGHEETQFFPNCP